MLVFENFRKACTFILRMSWCVLPSPIRMCNCNIIDIVIEEYLCYYACQLTKRQLFGNLYQFTLEKKHTVLFSELRLEKRDIQTYLVHDIL